MNVIPFRPRSQPQAEPLAFAIGARVDLRIGALAAGVVRPRGELEDLYSFSNLARTLRGARMAWRERGAQAPLVLAIASEVQNTLEADLLSEAAFEAGCTRHMIGFELNEREIVNAGPALPEGLRARGWNVLLRGDPQCPLPFGARVRALYNEIVVDVPDTPDPFLALENGDRTPLGRRILAAREAGMLITAESVRSAAQARILAIAGFDRGGGPLAEAGLR
ncbi:hypothetical protein [Vitreimonas flagellata]|uniref:hypothetical protein n=1 Tax=Vitreimonas flagellata TaxID=2560861 RepID=UPI001074BBC3|nr:hypothetical protein [Vitreimonas flagellata]